MINVNDKSYGLPDMYRSFIEDSQKEYKTKLHDISHYRYLLNKIKFYIEERRDIIQNSFGICIYNYWEWNTDEPDDSNKLFNDVSTLYNSFDNYKTILHRTDYLEFIKYLKLIRTIKYCELQAIRISKRKDISFKEFRDYLKRYYQQVNKELLYARVYSFSHGIGNILIERIINKQNANSKKYIDWHETKLAKDALIAKGLKPYNKEDAELYAKCKKEYDGVPYVVYRDLEYSCRVMLCDRHFKSSHVSKFRTATTKIHETQDNILKRCNNIEDIINLEYDVKSRLSMIRKVDPSYTQKFIRNDEQKSVVSGKYRSKIRQRLQY